MLPIAGLHLLVDLREGCDTIAAKLRVLCVEAAKVQEHVVHDLQEVPAFSSLEPHLGLAVLGAHHADSQLGEGRFHLQSFGADLGHVREDATDPRRLVPRAPKLAKELPHDIPR
eukprot:3558200-Lingulodinium_polyedra.AAC.1